MLAPRFLQSVFFVVIGFFTTPVFFAIAESQSDQTQEPAPSSDTLGSGPAASLYHGDVPYGPINEPPSSGAYGTGPAESLYGGDLPYRPINRPPLSEYDSGLSDREVYSGPLDPGGSPPASEYDSGLSDGEVYSGKLEFGGSPPLGEYLGKTWMGFVEIDNVSYYAFDRALMRINDTGETYVPWGEAEQRLADVGIAYQVPKYGMSADHIKYVIDLQKRKAAREEYFSRNESTLNYLLSIPVYLAAMMTDLIYATLVILAAWWLSSRNWRHERARVASKTKDRLFPVVDSGSEVVDPIPLGVDATTAIQWTGYASLFLMFGTMLMSIGAPNFSNAVGFSLVCSVFGFIVPVAIVVGPVLALPFVAKRLKISGRRIPNWTAIAFGIFLLVPYFMIAPDVENCLVEIRDV